MERIKYAVIRNQDPQYEMSFKKWHSNEKDAQEEAERLARKHQAKFWIVKLVGYCEIDTIPVKKEFWS